jgi:hypothetical protein
MRVIAGVSIELTDLAQYLLFIMGTGHQIYNSLVFGATNEYMIKSGEDIV